MIEGTNSLPAYCGHGHGSQQPSLRINQVSIMSEENVTKMHDGILVSFKEKGNTVICDETGGHYVE